MKRSETQKPHGFTQAEELELSVAERMRRQGGVDEAASAVREWADDDVAIIAAAEDMARHQHRDDSAEILHRARVLAA